MTKVLTSIALIILSPLALACDYPAPPTSLPDGATANRSDMLSGVKTIGAYQDNMTLYLACIESDEGITAKSLSDGDNAGRKQNKRKFTKRYNAAVNEQTKTVDKFNAEIRRFKRRSK